MQNGVIPVPGRCLLLLLALGTALSAGPALSQEGVEDVATGLGVRFVQIQTPLTLDRGVLEAVFTHRFAEAAKDAGPGALWGLGGGSYVGLGVDYAFLKNVSVQVYWANSFYDYEFAAKGTLLRPTPKLPVAIGLRGGLDWNTYSGAEKFSSGFAQLLASATIADRVTIAVSPSYVQRTRYHDDVWNVPIDLQVRILDSWYLLGELIPKKGWTPDATYQWSVAIQKTVYHHKFALYFGNTLATTMDQMIGGDLGGAVTDRNLHIGFNISRAFDLVKN